MVAWYAPLIILGYFLIGYAVSRLVMSVVARIVYQQELLEGDFRFVHMRVRTCSEAIALLEGSDRERLQSQAAFLALLDNKKRLILWQFGLNATTNLFTYFGSIVNYLVVALPILVLTGTSAAHLPPPGSPEHLNALIQYVSEGSFACIMLIQGFTQLLNVSQYVSSLVGYTAR
jgi:ATP-binding cassette, subfamily D (ALD), member 4